MKKKFIVKKKEEFNDIIRNSKYIKNDYFVIYIKKNNYNYNRFGIAISTKIGKAVFRNKIKRRIRNIIEENNLLFKKSYDYIIMIKRGKINYNYDILNNELKKLLNEEKIYEK